MPDFNKVIVMGRLTHDPEVRHIASGKAVATLRVATSKEWTSKDGEKKKDTLYIDVSVWDRVAENCGKYLTKGSSVHVEGYLKMETWEKDGQKNSKIKIEADSVQFLDPPKKSEEPADKRAGAAKPAGNLSPVPKSRPVPVPNPDVDEDDIPF